MIVDSRLMYSDDGSYIVFSKEYMEGFTFIVHVEGTPKALYRLWKENRDELEGRILYCIKDKDFFSGHSVEIEEGLYEYIGEF